MPIFFDKLTLPMELISQATLILIAIFALSSVFHGLTGIGVTLIATTALASFYPMSQVILLTVIPCLVINLVVFLDGGQVGYYLKKYWLLALTSFVGSFLGAKLLFIIAQHYLLVALGLLIIGYVLMTFVGNYLGKSFKLPNNKPSLIISGTVAGVLGGATNAMSPLLVMYLLSATKGQANAKAELIKSSNLCYVVGKVAQFITLYPLFVAMPVGDWGVLGVVTMASLSCLYVGFYFRDKLPQAVFRQLVLVILLVLGIKSLVNGLL